MSTITLQTIDRHVQVCTIAFGPAGSVHVAFPYFPQLPGIVSQVELPPVLTGELKLIKRGRLTSHHVKYRDPIYALLKN